MGEDQPAEEAPTEHESHGGEEFFSKLSGYVSQSAGSFVAFFFLVLAAGILLGFYVVSKAPEFIFHATIAPVVLGLVAYYNRALAVLLFIAALAFLVFAV